MSEITGEGDEKGKVMGIFRSLGALARALGPTVACAGNVSVLRITITLTNNVYVFCDVK